MSERLGYLLDCEYVGQEEKARLVFLDPDTQEIFYWLDTTGHRSYLLTDALETTARQTLKGHPEYIKVERVIKYDALQKCNVELTKATGKTPLAIGGETYGKGNFRNELEGFSTWEDHIRYNQNYLYDLDFVIGLLYKTSPTTIPIVVEDDAYQKRFNTTLKRMISIGTKDTLALRHWVRIFESGQPSFKYVAIDIEVLPETPKTLPSADIAKQPIIAISFVNHKGQRKIFLLRRSTIIDDYAQITDPKELFDTEKEMIEEFYAEIALYPFVLTFNGDNFDLKYLSNRSKVLGVARNAIPIYMQKTTCKIDGIIHIDLYPFMKNPSIQVYAFGARYKDFDLNSISKAILGKEKIKLHKEFADLSYKELSTYCLNDAELTAELCAFGNNTVPTLIMTLGKMSNLGLYALTRDRISSWIISTYYYLHRRMNWLIPSRESLLTRGGVSTISMIKGKKYKGAFVKEPIPGVFFDVVVMDFASLYPSEIKEHNIGYSSINCGHPECLGNVVPETTHHTCTKTTSLEADTIGSLRDIRVNIYKPLSADKTNPFREYYNTLQQAIKVYLNASYGVSGSETFPLYCPPVAESIAAWSRTDIHRVIDQGELITMNILYGDTDSTAIWKPTQGQIDALQAWAFTNLGLDLSVDKVYRYAIFSKRKKNYLGILKDGKADIKGLTGKKKHSPTIIKNAFNTIVADLGTVQTPSDYDKVQEKVRVTITTLYKTLAGRSWASLDELAYHFRLSRNVKDYDTNPQHVRVARALLRQGETVRQGDVIDYIKTVGKENATPLAHATNKDVDVGSYIEMANSTFMQITEAMDIELAVVLSSNGTVLAETSLNKYFG